ncbi:hypothetical protein FI667_g2227, partial [Globisporangium splendens]
MAFRREVPSLDKLVLKYISKSVRHAGQIVNDGTIERMHRISKPAKTRTHKVKQEIIRALLQGGRVTDDILPDSFFHASMTRIEIIGAKISTKFVTKGITKFIEKHPNHAKFTRVHISGHPVTDNTLKTIMSKCRKIHSLSIGYCAVSDDAVIALLKKRDAMSRLCLHWNVAITDQLLHYIAASGRNIQELNLCGAIVSAIHVKMGATNDAEPSAAVPPAATAEGEQEPERKRLKKIDFRYTTYVHDN